MAIELGRILNERYRVDAFLGAGAMAEVYKVFDLDRAVPIAIKALHSDLAEDRVFLRRFKREGQTLAKLQHPNIVRFYGLEEQESLVFMLMDYIDGTTLRKKMFDHNQPYSAEETLDLVQPICAALTFAHKQGFVHCDVKPANIMIDRQGKVYLSDFGIARITESSTKTLMGAGTPAYMAPEQILGNDPVPQTDIYALGIILYELLSGCERPFTGENTRKTGSTNEKILWEHLHLKPPSLIGYNPGITPQIEAAVFKCLEKEPENRYKSALELFNALTDAVMGQVQPVTQPVKLPVKPQIQPQTQPVKVISSPRIDPAAQPQQVIVQPPAKPAQEIKNSPEKNAEPVRIAPKPEVATPSVKTKKRFEGSKLGNWFIFLTIIGILIIIWQANTNGKTVSNSGSVLATLTSLFTSKTATPSTTSNDGGEFLAYTKSGNINLRVGPGLEYGIVSIISEGKQVSVRSKNTAGDWLYVFYDNLKSFGWIRADLLSYDFDLNILPTKYDIPPTPVTNDLQIGTAVPSASP